MTDSFERQAFDSRAYFERIHSGPCFICEMVDGKLADNHVVYQDDRAIVFLNKYPTLYGTTIVSPREHREQVTGDFSIDEYIDLQRLIYQVAEAVREETSAERVYILSLGSQQGNKHVHWHIAPLPSGVPFEQQQLATLRFSSGVLKIPDAEMIALAARLRERIERSQTPLIRSIAICVFRHDDKILVFEGYDSIKNQVYHRPLGGGIEPSEYSQDTIVREIREEIHAEVTHLRYLGTLENVFINNGKPGHQIVMVYDGKFVDASFYRREQIDGEDDGTTIKVTWKALDYFHNQNAAPLYPDGLLDMLMRFSPIHNSNSLGKESSNAAA